MTDDIKNDKNFKRDSDELFTIVRIPWNSTADEEWSGFKNQMSRRKKGRIIQFLSNTKNWQIAAAAVLIISLSVGLFINNYTVEVKSLAATDKSVELPDGSIAYLNAQSKISYKPYWWMFERTLELNGEAFFEVNKGKNFRVESVNGITEVLGTTFNILGRNKQYEVICVTGKVKVESKSTNEKVILYPSQKASLEASGRLKIEKDVNTENVKAWTSNLLIFTSTPFAKVLNEIENQYNVEILLQSGFSLEYTGSFEKVESVEEVLHMICRPFNLNITKESEKRFIISD